MASCNGGIPSKHKDVFQSNRYRPSLDDSGAWLEFMGGSVGSDDGSLAAGLHSRKIAAACSDPDAPRHLLGASGLDV
ncbi:hypothetical protein [Sphingobacterium faecale]|uniref:hypothetical protein n=1 Tax=Sphingobacterium faecale TaxID=2803775 RepID=UPI001923A032|nr:hypothetical protein [Sphingobacterium faecale]